MCLVVIPGDGACEHSAYPFSPDAQPFTPKTTGVSFTETDDDDDDAISAKSAPHVLSPNAAEFVPKNYKPPSKVVSIFLK